MEGFGFVGQSGRVAVFDVLYFLLFIFWLLLIGRIIVEFIRTFARDWKPTGFVVVILEAIFTVTDPPVKLLRRLIPPLNLGGIRLDLSIMVLLFIVYFLMAFIPRSGGSEMRRRGAVAGPSYAPMCQNGMRYTVGSNTRDALSELRNACLTAYLTREGILPCR